MPRNNGCDSDSESSQSSTYENDRLQPQTSPVVRPTSEASLSAVSVVVHLDVDAFYCQCEERRDPTLATLPLAIGQKHIVVTCNYVARARGVTKLMLRTAAMELCPDLVIVEGSDLTPFRRESRRIYAAFRQAVASLPGGTENLARKGGMDEMFADITAAVRVSEKDEFAFSKEGDTSQPFVYGNDASSTEVSISEDQSGATARISASPAVVRGHERGDWGDEAARAACAARLQVAAALAGRLRREVRRGSGFRACAGVSTSPMLAKLAAELRKPDSLNVLHPWCATAIVDALPLRKVPGLGGRTLQSLAACLQEHNGQPEASFWACRDLLRVPRSFVANICGEERCELLLQRCRGVDPLRIVDDYGGLAKTVSVEDSYKRGTVTTIIKVLEKIRVLYGRLSPLLDDRRLDSKRPDLAYPKTIRLTLRFVDHTIVDRKRPFVTKSIQSPFEGRRLMADRSEEDRREIIRAGIRPLLGQILLDNVALDVTKLNIAVTGFADLGLQSLKTGSKQSSMTHFFAAGKGSGNTSPRQEKQKEPPLIYGAIAHSPQKRQKSSHYQQHASQGEGKVDPSFLAALPADIRAEVERDILPQVASCQSASSGGKNRSKIKKAGGKINHFFSKM